MATRRWLGNAPEQAQVVTVTIDHTSNGNVVTITHGGRSISATSAGTDVGDLVDDLVEEWNDSIYPQFNEITASNSSDTLVLTADNAGVPFDITLDQTGTGGNVEVKTVTVNNSPTGGTWEWIDSTYGTASALAYNISAANLQTALEVLYGVGNVTVSGSAGGPWTVTFGGTLTQVNIPNTTFTNTSLTGGNATVTVTTTTAGSPGTDEVQTITFYGSPSGGTFTVTFNGFTTAAQAYNVSAANLQTALEGLSSIGSGNITVSGAAGGPYTCTFAGTLAATAVSSMTVDASALTGGTIYGAIATTTPGVAGVNARQVLCVNTANGYNEIVSIERSGTVSGGTFTLSYGQGAGIVTTAAIAYNAKLYEIIEALESAIEEDQGASYRGPTFAPLYASRANYTMSEAGGKHFIQCIGDFGFADIDTGTGSNDKLTIDASSLTGGGTYTFPGATYSSDGSGSGTLPTSGTFWLRFSGQTTSLLTYSQPLESAPPTTPTAAQVQSALEALSTIGSGNVVVTALGDLVDKRGYEMGWLLIEFQGTLAGTTVSEIEFLADSFGSADMESYILRNGEAGTSEVQTLTLSGTPGAGTFTLSYGAETTAAIAYNAAASAVDSALEALSAIPAGGVTCTGGALPGTPVVITFGGALAYTDVPELVVDDTGLKVIVAETTPGVTETDEVQTVALSGSPHGGTATLTYDGQTTGNIAYNASAATIQTALEALSNIAPGDVALTGGPWPSAVTVTFGGTLAATNVAAITGSGSGLNNGTVTETSVNPIVQATTTANSGPSDWDVAANWSGDTVPVTNDTVIIDQGSSPIKYHLDQSDVTLTALYHYARYTGEIGLPEVNTDFASQYYEFRTQYLTINSPIVQIGIGDGNSSGRIKLNLGSATAATVDVYKTSSPIDEGIEACLVKMVNASAVLNVNRGSVGVAIYPGETSTIPTLRVGYFDNVSGDAQVRCGTGVTLTTIEQSGGKLVTQSAFTTHTMTDGELIHYAGAVTTMKIDRGSVRYISNGTLTTVLVGSGGNLDFREDMRPVTVTNVSLYEGFEIHDPKGRVTPTNGYDFVRCTPSDGIFDVKPDQTWTPSSI